MTPAIETRGLSKRYRKVLLIRRNGPVIDPAFQAADVGLEELVLGYMSQHAGPPPARLAATGEDR